MVETVTFKGKPLKLSGEMVKVGDKAPDCMLTNAKMEDVALSSYKGKLIFLMSVPSLDTPVCSKESYRFNQELGKFGKEIVPIVVSMDLPFAQARWCEAKHAESLILLSDFKHRALGEKFGLRIPDLGLLARSIFILDKDMKVLNRFLVKEVTEEPNYEEILNALTARVG